MLFVPLLFLYSVFDHPDLIRKDIDFLEFIAVEGGVQLYGLVETVAVEAVHAGEDVELLVEEGLKALLALVT